MGELVDKKHRLQWMVPFFLALLPGYVDNMTSVHDDVIGSVAGFMFLWLSVRLLKRDFDFLLIAGWIVSAIFCYYARETSRLLIVIAPLVILFRLFPKKTGLVMSTTIGIALFAGGMLFEMQDASQWYSYPARDVPNRIRSSQALYGEHVFSIPASSKKTISFGQSFAPETIKPYRNKLMTLGFWSWADSKDTATLPIAYYRTSERVVSSDIYQIEVGTTPSFQTINFEIPYDARHAWLNLSSSVSETRAHIYFDGFVLVDGDFSDAPSPVFSDDSLSEGVWNGHFFVNLIRNPSAEHAWLSFKPIVNKSSKIKKYFNASLILATLQDWEGFGWYYKIIGSSVFQEFWGQGAGTQVPLIGHSVYNLLQLISFLSLIGFGMFIYRSPKSFMRIEAFIFALVLAIIWLATMVRGIFAMFEDILIVPYARFAYPAYIPTALLICLGVLEVLQRCQDKLDVSPKFIGTAFGAFMGALSMYAIFSFGGYFYPWLLHIGYLLFFFLLIGAGYIVINIAAGASSERTN